MLHKTQAAGQAPNGSFFGAPSSRLRRVIVLAGAMLASLASPLASAYDFSVESVFAPFHYVHMTTVSSLCHDRTPLDVNRGDQPQQRVTGSTSGLCLIDGVQASLGYVLLTWNELGVAGGAWFYRRSPNPDFGDIKVCYARPGAPLSVGDC